MPRRPPGRRTPRTQAYGDPTIGPSSGIAVAGLWLLLASTAAPAGEEVEFERDLAADGALLVRGARGSFEIIGWDRAQLRVHGELDDLATGLTFDTDGPKALLQVELPQHGVNWGDGSDLRVYVPNAIHLRIDTISAEVDLTGMSGKVAVRTVSGDVEGSKLGTLTDVKTTSGDVELSGATGTVRVVTTSGDVVLEVDATDLQVDTMSGDIELSLARFDSVRTSTVSGELNLSGHMNRDGRVEGTTVSGDIALRLAKPVDAEVDCRTGPSGTIKNGFNDAQAKQAPGGARLKTVLGDGTGLIHLSTVAGTIGMKPRR